jgi:hypothetical protein
MRLNAAPLPMITNDDHDKRQDRQRLTGVLADRWTRVTMIKRTMVGGMPERRYRLECGHYLYFREAPPRPGEMLWCKRCHEYRRCMGEG